MAISKIETLSFRGNVESVLTNDGRYTSAIETAMASASMALIPDRAEVSPIGPNDQPRMLHMTAWICHAEDVNDNGKAFKLADLESVIKAGLFQAPYFGMVDYNHDFKAYGAWYKADLKLDPKTGTYGIMAEGAMFAWAYQELADRLLAMQSRNGFIDFSMACIANHYESAVTEQGRAFDYLCQPVFFTTSVLDVAPADRNAVGSGSEDPTNTSADREQRLMSGAATEENTMTEKETTDEAATVVLEETDAVTEAAVADEVSEEVVTKVPVTEEATTEICLEVTIEDAEDEAEELMADPTEAPAMSLQDTIDTLKMALKAAEDLVAKLSAENVTLATYKTSTEAVLAAEVAKREDAERAALREARLLELPESVRTEMQTVEKASLLESWVAQDEPQWGVTKSLFALASSGKSRTKLEASAEEGRLALGGETSESGFAIDRYRK